MSKTALREAVDAADVAMLRVCLLLEAQGDERWREVSRAAVVLAQFQIEDADDKQDETDAALAFVLRCVE